MNRAASRIEEALAKTPCLMGEAPNASDLTLASMLYYGAIPERIDKTNPIAAFFRRGGSLHARQGVADPRPGSRRLLLDPALKPWRAALQERFELFAAEFAVAENLR
jgi:glutathione S-transferase